MMTVGELISILESLDEDTEVRLIQQPNWPFEYSIAGVTTKRRAQQVEDEESCREDVPYDEPDVVFIVEGQQLCYGSRAPFDRQCYINC